MKENLKSKGQVSLNGLPVSQLPARRFGERGLLALLSSTGYHRGGAQRKVAALMTSVHGKLETAASGGLTQVRA